QATGCGSAGTPVAFGSGVERTRHKSRPWSLTKQVLCLTTRTQSCGRTLRVVCDKRRGKRLSLLRFFPARTWMRRVVDLRERLKIKMRVHLRAGNRRVSEHFLHGAEVAGRLQNVRGERMTQHVRMDVSRKPLLDRPCREPPFDRSRGQPPSLHTDEQCIF